MIYTLYVYRIEKVSIVTYSLLLFGLTPLPLSLSLLLFVIRYLTTQTVPDKHRSKSKNAKRKHKIIGNEIGNCFHNGNTECQMSYLISKIIYFIWFVYITCTQQQQQQHHRVVFI